MADVTLNIRHNANQAAPAVGQLADEMGRMATQSKSASTAGTAAANGFKKIGAACLNVGKSASHGASGLSKFVSSLGRIAFYRAIRSAIRYVTDSFKQGLEAAYNWSKEQGGANAKLAAAMDNLSAASGRMKLQLGAAFGGLIVAIEPVLIRIINLVTAAAEAITRFFAVLNGQNMYKKAVGGLEKTGNAAGGAAKKMKGLLASWDELNVIGKESGGGGGGKSGKEWTGDYEWAKTESKLGELLKEGKFFDIGEAITSGLAEAFASIDKFLDDVQKYDIGGKLAEILNGAISDSTKWENIGQTVGKFLGVITEAILKFFTEINYKDLIKSIGSFFIGLAEGFFAALKDAFPSGSFLDNVFEGWYAIIKSLKAIDFDEIIGKSKAFITNVGKFFRKIKAEIGKCLEYVKAFFKTVKQVISDNWSLIKLRGQKFINDLLVGFLTKLQDFLQSISDGPIGKILKFIGVDLDKAISNVSRTVETAKRGSDELDAAIEAVQGRLANGFDVEANVDRTKIDEFEKIIREPWEVYVSPKVDQDGKEKVNTDLANLTRGRNVKTIPKLEEVEKFNKEVKDNVTGAIRGINVEPRYGSDKKFFTDLKEKVTSKTSETKVSPKLGSVEKFNTDMKAKVTDQRNVKVVPGLSIPEKFKTDMSSITGSKTLSIEAKLSNAKAFNEELTKAAKVKVEIRYRPQSGTQTTVGSIETVGITDFQGFASGGFPTEGDLFWARENGPELVGTMAGKTAVANNDQIVAGIKGGVAQANSEQNELLRQQNAILMQILKKDFIISPSVSLGQVMARSAALYGRA